MRPPAADVATDRWPGDVEYRGVEEVHGATGEHDEEERCALFLRQLDPGWPPADRE